MLDSTRSGVDKTIEIGIYFWKWHKKNLFWLKLCVHVCWFFACVYVCVCAHICVYVARDSNYGLTTISSICMVSNCDNKIDDDYYDYCNNISDTSSHMTSLFHCCFCYSSIWFHGILPNFHMCNSTFQLDCIIMVALQMSTLHAYDLLFHLPLNCWKCGNM